MTANELADSMERLIELTTVSKVRDCDFSAIATMLRQQQAEIEALKETRCVACGWNPNLIGGKK